MTSALRKDAVVQPDGTIALSVPELAPGQHVRVTIETSGAAGDNETAETSDRPLTAVELLKLPRAERDRILAQAAAEAAEAYHTDPELTDFAAFGEDDLHDAQPE